MKERVIYIIWLHILLPGILSLWSAASIRAQPRSVPTAGTQSSVQGYVLVPGQTDSLLGTVIYNYRQAQISLQQEGGRLLSFSTQQLSGFGIYDQAQGRLRRFVRCARESPLGRVQFLEELVVTDSLRLLRRLPFVYVRQADKAGTVRRLADYVPEQPRHLSWVERRLYRRAKRDALHYQDAKPIYYLAAGAATDSLVALTHSRRWLFWLVRRHNPEAMLVRLGSREPWARTWIARHGDPFNRQRDMDAFLAACQTYKGGPEI